MWPGFGTHRGGGGGGEHVLVAELEAVDALQDDVAAVFALEEVRAAEDGGHALRLVPLHQHRGGRVIRLHPPATRTEPQSLTHGAAGSKPQLGESFVQILKYMCNLCNKRMHQAVYKGI